MKEIILNTFNTKSPNYRKYKALVDDEDFERVNKHKWCVTRGVNTFYAITEINNKKFRMHQFLTGFKETDHIDSNGLNNQRNNLREVTRSQNNMNRYPQRNCSSKKYKGISWDKASKKWTAQIRINGKKKGLGSFIYEHNAAHAYNFAAQKHYGEYAKLNTITI